MNLLRGPRQCAQFIRFGIQEANDPCYKSNGLLSEHQNSFHYYEYRFTSNLFSCRRLVDG